MFLPSSAALRNFTTGNKKQHTGVCYFPNRMFCLHCTERPAHPYHHESVDCAACSRPHTRAPAPAGTRRWRPRARAQAVHGGQQLGRVSLAVCSVAPRRGSSPSPPAAGGAIEPSPTQKMGVGDAASAEGGYFALISFGLGQSSKKYCYDVCQEVICLCFSSKSFRFSSYI